MTFKQHIQSERIAYQKRARDYCRKAEAALADGNSSVAHAYREGARRAMGQAIELKQRERECP